MAMIPVGNNVYIDTDDLEQPEYHYFRKAQRLNLHKYARRILPGNLTAIEIETNPMYADLSD